MEAVVSIFKSKEKIKSVLLDGAALTVIYFLPSISHLLSFPLYLIEPMRIMLVFALVHTEKKNAYILALTLPVFSFLVSAHPSIPKTGLITAELLLNVWLFFIISEKVKNGFVSLALSILLSKLFYYAAKFAFISLAFIGGGLISTPIYIQLVMIVLLSTYFLVYQKLSQNKL